MRIRIRHATNYRYSTPVRGVIQVLRLTPRSCGSQAVVNWRVEVTDDCRLQAGEDAYGNIVHTFSATNVMSELNVLVEGEVETFETCGIFNSALERFPPELYLRETPLTTADGPIRAFACETGGARRDRLAALHELMAAIYGTMTFDVDATHSATTAGEAFLQKKGVCQDFAHLFIACARALEIPARYVSGYYWRSDGVEEQTAGHAWTEAFIDDLGWVGFDPTHGVSPTRAYVRLAAAPDYLNAAPIRGSHIGGGGECLRVQVAVSAREQSQG